MSQVRFGKSWSVAAWVRVGTLAVALALVAGTTYGQQPPAPPAAPPPEGKRAVFEPARPAQLSPQSQPVRVIVKPPDEKPAARNPTGALVLGEVLSGFMIVIFSVGGVAALAVGARLYFRATRPTDPVKLALTDPWVRANLERFEAGATDAQPDDAEPPLLEPHGLDG
jgi:hypothetical protein